jgi:hypothetical protein
MRRREILVVAVSATLLVFGPVGAFAQLEKLKGTTPEQRAAIETEFMRAKLSLTPDQTRAVADLNLKYAKLMDPVIKGSSGTFTKMLQMRQINNEKRWSSGAFFLRSSGRTTKPVAMRCETSSRRKFRKMLAASSGGPD